MPQAIEWAIDERLDVISICWGLKEDVPVIARAIENALKLGVVVVAPEINHYSIAFPARMKNVFCIGSADGKGSPSVSYSPLFGHERFSALGEGVKGALCIEKTTDCSDDEGLYVRKDGTSTAALVAAGIAAFLIDYTRQFMDLGQGANNCENMRKLFNSMSRATVGQSYRFLAPWYMFGAGRNTNELFSSALSNPPQPSTCTTIFDKLWRTRSRLSTSSGKLFAQPCVDLG